MKKIFALIVIVLSFCETCFSFEPVEKDVEIHKVVGGLYTLASAVELNGKTNPDIRELRNYFANVAEDFGKSFHVSKVKNSIWVGVSVDQHSTARHYLRSNAPDLGITNEPEGYTWLGGNEAWLKAADIVNGKLKPVKILSAEGDGTIFLSVEGSGKWWQSNPSFNSRASKEILKINGLKNPPKLYKPDGISESIYESVKPSTVIRVPDEMHMRSEKNSFDMEMGDVIFRPIPNVH